MNFVILMFSIISVTCFAWREIIRKDIARVKRKFAKNKIDMIFCVDDEKNALSLISSGCKILPAASDKVKEQRSKLITERSRKALIW